MNGTDPHTVHMSEVCGFYPQSLPGCHSSIPGIDRQTTSLNGILVIIMMNKFRNLILMQLNEMEVVLSSINDKI